MRRLLIFIFLFVASNVYAFDYGGGNFSTFVTTTETFTAAVTGDTLILTDRPVLSYAMQVKGIDTTALWDVRIEGSLNGQNFSQILQHTTITGDAAVLFSGSVLSPALYIRIRVVTLSVGVVVTLLGMGL